MWRWTLPLVIIVGGVVLLGQGVLSVNMDKNSPPEVGGIYSIVTSDGKIRVVKILATDPQGVHVRLYKNTFASRPETINPDDLKLGKVINDDGSYNAEEYSLGHAPLLLETFYGSDPKFITKVSVSDDELEGYKMWKDAMGGYFNVYP